MVSRWVARWFARALARIELEPPVRILLMRVVRLLVLLLFVIMALQNMGVELLPLLAGLSVAGAAIALATQGVLSNVAAVFTIIFTKPFRVGQYVQIVGVEGQVETITLFSTTLSHTDRSMIVIPNRKVVGEILHNYGRIRQLDVAVGVAYDTDLNSALAAIQEILRNNPRVLKDPAPCVQTTQLGNSAVVVAVKPWVSVEDFGDATGEINKAIVENIPRPRDRHSVSTARGAPAGPKRLRQPRRTPEQPGRQGEAEQYDADLQHLLIDAPERIGAHLPADDRAGTEHHDLLPGNVARERKNKHSRRIHDRGQQILGGPCAAHRPAGHGQRREHQDADAAAEVAAVQRNRQLGDDRRSMVQPVPR